MTFGQAFEKLLGQVDLKLYRAGWNGKGMFIQVQYPDKNSKMGHPYLYLNDVQGKLSPWTPNQLDLFGRDWLVA